MKLLEIFSQNNWKLKAIKRSREINSLKKRNKELLKSRDKTKVKNTSLRTKNKELEDMVKELNHELKKTEPYTIKA